MSSGLSHFCSNLLQELDTLLVIGQLISDTEIFPAASLMGLFEACTCLGMVDKQVSIVSKVKCVSIKGKGLMWLRAPPTDRIWFAFKEMPDLDSVTEPAIGNCCINSGCVLDAFVVHQLQDSKT